MAQLTEENALAILVSNLKRKKRNVDILTIAESCKYLKELYGSWKEVARRADVSYEMIREFVAALNLPERAKQLVRDRKIDRVEVVEELSKIKGTRRQIEAAEAFSVQRLTTEDIRSIVQYANANLDLSIEGCIKRVLESKPIIEKRYVAVIELRNSTLEALRDKAERLSVAPQNLVKSIIEGRLGLDAISYDMRGRVVAITLREGGLKSLRQEARKLKLTLEELAETVIEDWLAKSHP